MPVQHKDAALTKRHAPHNWEYADAAARTAATGFVTTDVGKLARQLDDNSWWVLTDDSPVTWIRVIGQPAGAAGGDLSGSYPNPATVKARGVTLPTPVAGDDGKYLKYVHGSTAYALDTPAGGGGGGGGGGVGDDYNPDAAPTSPATEDDEFTNATLDAKWTETLTGSPTRNIHTTWKSHYYVSFTGNQAALLEQAYAPAGDFSLTLAARHSPQIEFQGCHIYVLDAGGNEQVRASWEYNAGRWIGALGTRDSGTWAYNRSTLNIGGGNNRVFLHLQRAGSIWGVWVSYDGLSFWRIGTYSKSLTVARFQIELAQSGATIPARAGFNWLRRDWVTL